MVLLSFSITDHIQKIKAGLKFQTSRIPRKPRSNGKPAYSVGEKAQLYYRSRMRKASCDNCILNCGKVPNINWCEQHTNFFGESEIIDIIHYHSGDYKERYHEVWTGYTLSYASKEDKESWAIADGFIDFKEASEYFKTSHGGNWADLNWDVIVWGKIIK